MASKKEFQGASLSIEGLPELMHNLGVVLPTEARNLARSTVHSVAGVFRDEMRRAAPTETGTLRKAIVSYRNKMEVSRVSSDVIITNGANAKYNAWYWHFVEWGTATRTEHPFVVPTVERLQPKIEEIFRNELKGKLERSVARKAKKMNWRPF